MKVFKSGRAILFGIFTSLLLASFIVSQANAQGTQISVIPASQTVGEEGQPLPTDPFIINITLTDFTDVYTWQIRVLFNPTILNCTGAWYPNDHIFAGKTTAPSEPVIDNTAGSVLYGNSLVGAVPGINGTEARLCQIEFTGMAVGLSTITFKVEGTGRTFLLNSDGVEIEFTANPGEVTVIPEYSSVLLLALFLVATTVVLLNKKLVLKKRL
jgi:hypothetical protein